jgi:two-component system phosphate regulon sensor histidine kinase PhoR
MPLIVSGLFVLLLLVNNVIKNAYYDQTERSLESQTKIFKRILKNNPLEDFSYQKFCDKYGDVINARVTIIDKDGKVLGDSDKNPKQMDNHLLRPEIVEAVKFSVGTTKRFSETINEDFMYYAQKVLINNSYIFLRVSVPLNNIKVVIKKLQNQIIIIGSLIGIVLLFISFHFSKVLTNPIEIMRKEAKKFVSDFELPKPIPTPKTRELASLSISLNKMAKEVDSKIKIVQQERDEKESLLASIDGGIIALDENGKIIFINTIAKDYLSISSQIIEGENYKNVLKHKKITSFIKDSFQPEEKIQKEISFKLNKKRYFLLNASPLIRNTMNTGVLILINDITFQKQLEKLRSDFVANVSHELKTPITSIIGFLELLMIKSEDNNENKNFLEKAFNQANRLNAIIDDLLKLSKIESQEEDNTITLKPQNLKSILISAKDDTYDLIKKNKNTLSIECVENITATVDSQLLREAIINLLENSIKYGDKKSPIKIVVKKGSEIQIHVENIGEPIYKKYHKRIFQRFYRIDKSRDRKAGGTGLGLAIVKHIAIVNGGEVSIKSLDNRVTRFTISLPI